ncbi:MAG: hypothetical protein AUH94_05615 [Ktedonobacter sp. 13_2_20CM_2_54_8]|nr:MAG: hypothetical protein AUH94_05615 [Ktedonobacter sp. 13_2_20CM_2_54_8]OLD80381.1 MAG: hypothetical protein AUG54_05300 [Ktedonobacter sp. 13_1_20CM_4_53_7]
MNIKGLVMEVGLLPGYVEKERDLGLTSIRSGMDMVRLDLDLVSLRCTADVALFPLAQEALLALVVRGPVSLDEVM